MQRTRLFQRPVTLLAALAAALALTAVPAATAAPGGLAGGGFRTGSAVLVLQNGTSVAEAVIQATPPQSFCYVSVAWPAAIDANYKVTATWNLDCRSRANPNLPAPDIFMLLMNVRVYQGSYTPWDRGREVGQESCSGRATNRSCSATSLESMTFGAPYYTILHVQVALTGGTNQVGEFYTDPIRRT